MTTATLARQAADRDATLAEGLPDPSAYDPPTGLPEPLEAVANRLQAERDREAKERAEAKQADVPEGKVPVTIPGSGPGVPASVIHMDRLDYSELRRLRGEGLTWAELKRRFKLPSQALRAVAGDVDPEQGTKDREQDRAEAAAARPPRQPATRTDGKPRRRAATLDENLSIARRVHAGEPAAQVAAETGFATSTVMATYRWAKREQLLDPAGKE
jgi:hypothetical protein